MVDKARIRGSVVPSLILILVMGTVIVWAIREATAYQLKDADREQMECPWCRRKMGEHDEQTGECPQR